MIFKKEEVYLRKAASLSLILFHIVLITLTAVKIALAADLFFYVILSGMALLLVLFTVITYKLYKNSELVRYKPWTLKVYNWIQIANMWCLFAEIVLSKAATTVIEGIDKNIISIVMIGLSGIFILALLVSVLIFRKKGQKKHSFYLKW